MENATMTPSDNCTALVKRFEGFRSIPYTCPAGKATVGYGFTHYADGTLVTLTDQPMVQSVADEMLVTMLADYGRQVSELLTIPVNQNQFDALVDFAYNLGVGNLKTSTLLKMVNFGQFDVAAEEFGKWVHAGPKTLPGLVVRRDAERRLFTTEV
jgi:GH24 family phage-related lysozyme (muramidase)